MPTGACYGACMTSIINRHALKGRRQELRGNATPHERLLWERLRKNRLGVKFRRQASLGNYVVDFYCPKRRLAIELDGAHHAAPEVRAYDENRTQYLVSLGVRVLRFGNHEITADIENVCLRIAIALE